MYKVFFNDSTIQIASGINKLLNNNMTKMIESYDYDSVYQIVSDIEAGTTASDFVIQHSEVNPVWDQFRKHFKQIPAAGGLVQDIEGSFLFIRRFGVWDLPKGKIEKMETPEIAALREVEEECGLSQLHIVRPLDSTFHIYRSPYRPFPKKMILKETKWFLMRYSGDEIPQPQVDEGIEEVRWVKVSELTGVLVNTYASLREFLEKTLPAI
jgi:8-oxo-dGTP pyrophosphatase MutT (NUDIX family)